MRIIQDSTGYVAVYSDQAGNSVTIPLVGWMSDFDDSSLITALVPDMMNGIAIKCTDFKGTDGELTFEGLDCGHYAEQDEDKPEWEI